LAAERTPIIAGLACANRRTSSGLGIGQTGCHPRIHTFLATSDIHLQYKLKISREECVARIAEMVALARSLCEDVEFSPEDAGRSDPEFLYRALAAAIQAGATTLNIPDTVGYTAGRVRRADRRDPGQCPGADQVIISAHCHNDLGLATANTLAAVRSGRQVEVTVNGIGERAGNTRSRRWR
jgi:2-isopropylmalate synthase